jgi:chromosomal replication initiator protein
MVESRKPGSAHRHKGDAPIELSPHPWDGFFTGPENELAFSAAQSLAHGQRDGISPLVVHGPAGVGKSRLLAGLVAEWLRRQPAAAVAHIEAIEFAESCIEAARQAARTGWSELHARFRTVGLLVLDDMEGLERITIACDELTHVLDALDILGASIAVSSRTPPGQWPRGSWPTRLTSRLASGLSVRIEPPGLATRRRHLLERARSQGLSLSAEAVESLAASADGYRTLDGWLARLTLQARLNTRARSLMGTTTAQSSPLDLATVTALLKDETEMAAKSPTIEAVAKAVAACMGLRASALRGPGRQASVAQARHLAMHLARLHTGLSFAAIGVYFGGRDPATVRYACKMAAAHLSTDPSLAVALASLPFPFL